MSSGDVIVKFSADDKVTPAIQKQIDEIKKLRKEYDNLELSLKNLKADKARIVNLDIDSDIASIKRLQNELKELKAQYATADSKSKAREAIKAKQRELTAAITKEINRQTIALKRQKEAIKGNEIALKREVIQRNKSALATKKEKVAIDKANVSRKKEDAIRRSLGTALIRHIRQVESLVVAYYAISRAIDMTVTKGVLLNKTIEDGTVGIAALIAANTEGGNSAERFSAAMAISADTVLELKKASVDTAATFPQLTQVFQQAIGGAMGAGKAMGSTLDEVINHTIKLSQRMTNIAAAIGMPMEQVNQEIRAIMEGTITKDARIAKMLGITTKDIDEAKKSADGLFKYLENKLKVFDVLEGHITFTKLVARFSEALDTVRIEANKPLFDDLKAGIQDATEYIKSHLNEWVSNIQNTYFTIKSMWQYYEPHAKMMWKLSEDIINAFGDLADAIIHVSNSSGLFTTVIKGWSGIFTVISMSVENAVNTITSLIKILGVLGKSLKHPMSFAKTWKANIDDALAPLNKVHSLNDMWKEAYKNMNITSQATSNLTNNTNLLANSYKELFRLSNQKYSSIAEINDVFSKYIQKYKDINPNIYQEVAKAVNQAISTITTGQVKLVLKTDSTMAKIEKYKEDAKHILSPNPAIDDLNKKYQPIFKRLETLSHDSNKKIANEAKKTLAIVGKAYTKELQKLTKTATNLPISQSFKIWESLRKINTKDLQAQSQAERSAKMTYYDATGQYDKEWSMKEEDIRSKYMGLLSPDEIDAIVAKYKKDFYEPIQNMANETAEIFKTMSKSLTSSLTQFFDYSSKGFMDFGNIAKSVIHDVYMEIIKTQVVSPMVSGIMGGFSSLFGIKLATGGVFQSGNITPFATGGAFTNSIVTQPTYFAYGDSFGSNLGVMGEAGAEAVMPLTRVGTDLGVKSTPSNVVINVENQSGTPVDMKKVDEFINDDGTRTINIVMNAIERNPDFRDAIKGIR